MPPRKKSRMSSNAPSCSHGEESSVTALERLVELKHPWTSKQIPGERGLQYTFTLTETFLINLQDPKFPIFHPHPRDTCGVSWEKLRKRAPSGSFHRPFAAINAVQKRAIRGTFKTEILDPFFDALKKRLSDSRSNELPQSHWQNLCAPAAQIFWRSKAQMRVALYNTFESVGGLLRPLPEAIGFSNVKIVEGRGIGQYLKSQRFHKERSNFYLLVSLDDTSDDGNFPDSSSASSLQESFTDSTVSDDSESDSASSSSCHWTAIPESAKRLNRVMMVVQNGLTLSRKDLKHIRDTFEESQEEGSKRTDRKRRRRALKRFAVLERLAHQMLKSNAPIGVFWTGNEILVFERDFDYDEFRMDIINAPITESDGNTTAPAQSSSRSEQIRRDLVLKAWDLGFCHLFEKGAKNDQDHFLPVNPAVFFAALALYAKDLLQQRPSKLDDAKVDGLAGRFNEGCCPCSASLAFYHANAAAPPEEDRNLRLPASAVAWPPPTSIIEVLQEAGTYHYDTDVGGGDDFTNVLVAFGQMPESADPLVSRNYLLVCSTQSVDKGRSAIAYPGTLHLLAKDDLARLAGPPILLSSTTDEYLQALPSRSRDVSAVPGGSNALPTLPLPHRLYRAREGLVSPLLRFFNGGNVPAHTAETHEIILKLPNLCWPPSGTASVSLSASTSSSSPDQAGDDRERLGCSRGLCDVAVQCKRRSHLCDHISHVLTSLQHEEQAMAVLRSGTTEDTLQQSCPWQALPLRLSHERGIVWPHLDLSGLLERTYLMRPHAGVPLDKLIKQARHSRRCRDPEVLALLLALQGCPARVAAIGKHLMAQLALLHKQGIVHGDIHSGNICLRKLPGPIDDDASSSASRAGGEGQARSISESVQPVLDATLIDLGHSSIVTPEERAFSYFNQSIKDDLRALCAVVVELAAALA